MASPDWLLQRTAVVDCCFPRTETWKLLPARAFLHRAAGAEDKLNRDALQGHRQDGFKLLKMVTRNLVAIKTHIEQDPLLHWNDSYDVTLGQLLYQRQPFVHEITSQP